METICITLGALAGSYLAYKFKIPSDATTKQPDATTKQQTGVAKEEAKILKKEENDKPNINNTAFFFM